MILSHLLYVRRALAGLGFAVFVWIEGAHRALRGVERG